ncbi:hypothetical protein GCM10010401_20990 [Rarobacter faecitabidus]
MSLTARCFVSSGILFGMISIFFPDSKGNGIAGDGSPSMAEARCQRFSETNCLNYAGFVVLETMDRALK